MSPPLFRMLLLLLSVLCWLPVSAAPEAPRIPDQTFSAATLGVPANQSAPVTTSLQAAIDHVARAGGGRLVLVAGDYVSGPLTLPSRIDLHLARGAVLRLLPLGADYPVSANRYTSLLSASRATDLRISGEGTIDGGGPTWWRAFRAKELTPRRPQLVSFERCDRVEFSGVTFRDPPNTHVALRLCREVVFRDLILDAPDDSPNTDGLNISGKNYLIERCRISTGDDNIVILTHSATDWPSPVCENFVIRDCALGFGHGLSIGSYTGGGISGLLAERITFDKTTSGIRLKADRDRGGLVENLVYRDIIMHEVKNPVFISSYYPKEPKSPSLATTATPTENTPRWKNILIENLAATGGENSVILWGLPERPLEDVVIRRTTIASKRGARLYYAGNLTMDAQLRTDAAPAIDRYPVTTSSP